MTSQIHQRGAAILVAMLIVALAATAAVALLQRQDVALRQLATARDYEQARWVLHGGTRWARSILMQDGRISNTDHSGELWATGLPSTEIEQGTVAGEIKDQQGLFNLNNLALEGLPSARDLAALRRLLEAIDLNADLADAIADWVDADQESLSGGGAEDAYYLRLAVPYRSANRAMVEIGELLRVRGFDEAAVARLRSFTTVLPRRTAVNVNLAPPEVLIAMVNGLTLPEARVLASGRAAAPMQSMEEFRARLPSRNFQWNDNELTVESQFFLVQGRAIVGKADVRMEALLERTKGGSMPGILWQRMR